MENVVIVGASGHGGMLLDCIEKEGCYNVVGFVDSFKEKGHKINGYEVLGNELALPQLMDKFNIQGVILALGNNWTRKNMAEKIKHIVPDLNFISTIHPSAIVGKGVKIGKGSAILPGSIVNANATIGAFCILNTNSSLGHDGVMSDFSSISSGVCTGGDLFLGRFSAISLGANIIEKVTIGEHSIIGAGSLVVKNVASRSIVYGSPARFIRRRIIGDPYLSGDRVVAESDFLAI